MRKSQRGPHRWGIGEQDHRAIAKSAAAIRRACSNRTFRVKVDRRTLSKKGLVEVTHASVNYLAPLASLCAKDKD